MNDYRKFVMALQNNNIKDYENYGSTKSDSEGFLYIKNKISGKFYKLDPTGKNKIKEISEEESKLKTSIKMGYKPIEEPLYKQIDEFDNIIKEDKSKHENFDYDDNHDNYDYDPYDEEINNYDFDEPEKLENLEKPPEMNFDEEFQKEMKKLKEEQEKMLEKNTKKKTGPKKKSEKNKKEEKEDKNKPRGWHLMKEYVDKDGNVFHKGIEQPHLKGTKNPTKK